MAARTRERVTAWVFALIFIFSTLALSVAIVWSNIQSGKQDNGAASQQAKTKGENMLQGTQLPNFTPVANVPELQKIDTVVGDGPEAKASDTVTIDYTGALASNGKIFQSTKDLGQPYTSPLSGFIQGWVQGIPGMKVGGTRRLVIPANLAYGSSSPSADIPPNSDLVFDITLHALGQ